MEVDGSDDFSFSIGVIFGFQPLIFKGVHCEKNHSKSHIDSGGFFWL